MLTFRDVGGGGCKQGPLGISADLRRLHGMVEKGWSDGAVALVLEGFELVTLPKPMLQRRRTARFRPYRAEDDGMWAVSG